MSSATQPGPATGAVRPVGLLERFTALSGSGAVLMMTARFGRSPVREAAYRFHTRYRDLDLKLSWRLFTGLDDWGKRWAAEQHTFVAGLILSAAGDPVAERAVARCLADLAALGRPLLWGAVSHRLRWHPRFMLSPNGWPPEEIFRPQPRMPGYASRLMRPSSVRCSIRSYSRPIRTSSSSAHTRAG